MITNLYSILNAEEINFSSAFFNLNLFIKENGISSIPSIIKNFKNYIKNNPYNKTKISYSLLDCYDYVLGLEDSYKFQYHNFNHTIDVVTLLSIMLMLREKYSSTSNLVIHGLLYAAMFHDSVYEYGKDKNNELMSGVLFKNWFNEQYLLELVSKESLYISDYFITFVNDAILATIPNSKVIGENSELYNILKDCDIMKNFLNITCLLDSSNLVHGELTEFANYQYSLKTLVDSFISTISSYNSDLCKNYGPSISNVINQYKEIQL